MKFRINSNDLQKKLDNLHKVARGKTTIPILSYLKMDVTNSGIVITASDLEVTLEAKVTPEEVVSTGSICVLADKFADVIRNFKDSLLEISLDPKNNLLIKSRSGKFKIPCHNSEDFPQLRAPENDNLVYMKASSILNGINKTIFAVYKSELRPILCGVNVDFKSDKTIFVGTDQTRIGISYDEAYSSFEQNVVLPTKLCSAIASIFIDTEEMITVSFDERNIKMEGVDYTVYSKQIEGEYINYNIALNQSVNTIVSMSTKELIDAVKRIMIFCSSTSNVIQVETLLGKVTITGEDVDFNLSAEESVLCENKEGTGIFKINGKYFLEIIQKISTEFIEMSFSDKHPLVYFNPVGTTEDYLFVLVKCV